MASVKNYSINLQPLDEYSFPVRGNSVRLVSSALDMPVYFKSADGGHDFYLEVGQRINFENEAEFISFVVYTKALVDHRIVLQVSSDAFIDSARVAGEVSVISGEVSRVSSGVAFIGEAYVGRQVGEYSFTQLSNPPGSGKKFVINKISFSSPDALNGIGILGGVANLTVLNGFGFNKMLGGAASVGGLRAQNNVTLLAGTQFASKQLGAVRSGVEFEFSEPFILSSGQNLTAFSDALNVTLLTTFQWFEVKDV